MCLTGRRSRLQIEVMNWISSEMLISMYSEVGSVFPLDYKENLSTLQTWQTLAFRNHHIFKNCCLTYLEREHKETSPCLRYPTKD